MTTATSNDPQIKILNQRAVVEETPAGTQILYEVIWIDEKSKQRGWIPLAQPTCVNCQQQLTEVPPKIAESLHNGGPGFKLKIGQLSKDGNMYLQGDAWILKIFICTNRNCSGGYFGYNIPIIESQCW